MVLGDISTVFARKFVFLLVGLYTSPSAWLANFTPYKT